MVDQIDPDELAHAYFHKSAHPSAKIVSMLTAELGDDFLLPEKEASIQIASDSTHNQIKDIRDAINSIDTALNHISHSLDQLQEKGQSDVPLD